MNADSSVLATILASMTPEQREQFAGFAEGKDVVYVNDALSVPASLSLSMTNTAFCRLKAMETGLSREQVEAEQQFPLTEEEDLALLEGLRCHLEEGVEIIPPPEGWRPGQDARGMPIRIETDRYGIPCRLDGGTLLAVHVGPPEETLKRPLDGVEEDVEGEPDLEQESEEVADAESTEEAGASPNLICTKWEVIPPGGRGCTVVDVQALEKLVQSQLLRRCEAGFVGRLRAHGHELRDLLSVESLAVQAAFTVSGTRGRELEVQTEVPADYDAGDFLYVLLRCDDVDVPDFSCHIKIAGVLEVVSGNGCKWTLRVPEDKEDVEVPESGFLMSVGDYSQYQKKQAAISVVCLGDPPSRPTLGKVISQEDLGLLSPFDWEEANVQFFDDRLTSRQKEAVCKALRTPDVCLIQGPPGTGKTSVISEIVRQATAGGLRVLLTAPTHVAVDNVLERIGFTDEVNPVRCVTEKKQEDLSEEILQYTYAKRLAPIVDRISQENQGKLKELQSLLERLKDAGQLLLELSDWLDKREEQEKRLDTIQGEKETVSQRVEEEHHDERRTLRNSIEDSERELRALGQAKQKEQSGLSSAQQRLKRFDSQAHRWRDRRRAKRAGQAAQREYAPVIDIAKNRLATAEQQYHQMVEQLKDLRQQETTVSDILTSLCQDHVPDAVANAVNDEVKEKRRPYDQAVDKAEARLRELKHDLDNNRRRCEKLKHRIEKNDRATKVLPRLRSAGWLRHAFSAAWWRSLSIGDFETDSERCRQEISKETKERPVIEAEIPGAQQHLEQGKKKRDVPV